MNELWLNTKEKIAALNQREKILVLITGLILLPGLIDYFLLQPQRDETTKWNLQTTAVNQRLVSFTTQQEELLIEIQNDPAMDLSRRIDGVKRALAVTKKAMIDYTNTLIAPEKMASMLENMLHERGELKLISLENLPVAPLFGEQQDQQEPDEEKGADIFGLYRHGIRLEFKGNYMNTMEYLEDLELLPWKFYWDRFSYEVQQHPSAIITINIYTLSTSHWWIGDKGE